MPRTAARKSKFDELVSQAKKFKPAQRAKLISLLTEDLESELPLAARRRKQPVTAKSLLGSGLVGLWRDRDDIHDSAAFARVLRGRAQRRSSE